MNPDPSEPTPTDDQSPYGYEGGGEEFIYGAEGAEVEGPAPHYDQGGGYDPGAAFVEENLQFGAPDAQYADPNQAYYDPGQAYIDPGQAYIDPGQAYADPGSVYVDPNEGYYPEQSESAASGGVYDDGPEAPPVRPVSVPSRSQKKKVARRVPKPSPVMPKRGGAGSKYRRPSYSGGGISMMSVLITLIALAMLGGVIMIVLPGDMSKIAGYPASPIPVPNPRNLLDEAQKVMMERKQLLTLSEEEVNQYLGSRLKGSQKGALATLVKFKGVYVDFSPGFAEIFIVREFFGRQLTMSSKIIPVRDRKGLNYQPVGWTLGRVDLGKRSIKPVVQLFIRLRSTCLDEFHTLEQMSEVIFEENGVVLDPVIKS